MKGTKKRTDVSKVDRRWRSDDGALASGRDFDPKRCARFFVRAVLRTIASWKLLPLFHLREAPSFPSDPDVSKEDERAMPLRKRSSSCPSHPALSRKKATSKEIHILSARFASLFAFLSWRTRVGMDSNVRRSIEPRECPFESLNKQNQIGATSKPLACLRRPTWSLFHSGRQRNKSCRSIFLAVSSFCLPRIKAFIVKRLASMTQA